MDGRGVMGFPLRLGLAFTLLALCLPVLSAMTEDFQEDVRDRELGREVEEIIKAADRVFYGGPGSTEVLEVHLAPGYSIEMGGEGERAYSISVLRGSEVVDTTYLDHPSVKFVGGTFSINSSGTIRITCVSEDAYGVRVTV